MEILAAAHPQSTVTLPATRRKNKLTISQQQQQQGWRLSLDSSNSHTIAFHPTKLLPKKYTPISYCIIIIIAFNVILAINLLTASATHITHSDKAVTAFCLLHTYTALYACTGPLYMSLFKILNATVSKRIMVVYTKIVLSYDKVVPMLITAPS
jgi:hypothetical protein